jgi:hypothetical protein
MLFQAIETYHRHVLENTKNKESTKTNSKTTLRERITEVFEYYSQILPYLSIKIGTRETFTDKVVRIRNALTHGNLRSDEIDNTDLFWLCKDLQLLLQLCFLSQLGFSNEEIKKIYNVNELRQIIDKELQNAITTINAYDPNMQTAYEWARQIKDVSRLPNTLDLNPDRLIDIVEGVQQCIGKEFAYDLENQDQGKDSSGFVKHYPLMEYDEERKSRFLKCIKSINKQYMDSMDEKEIISISLALWSGCLSAAKTLTAETRSGPNAQLRERTFEMIDKLSHDRPIFGKGVEIAPLWKVKIGQGSDVFFENVSPHSPVRKFEDLWQQKVRRLSEPLK